MKFETYTQFQIGLMFWVNSYKGERNLGLSIPFVDISISWIARKYRKAERNRIQKTNRL